MMNDFYEDKYIDHTKFGGLVFQSDFDRKTTMSEVVGHIISDMKFDEQCRKNIKSRRKNNGGK